MHGHLFSFSDDYAFCINFFLVITMNIIFVLMDCKNQKYHVDFIFIISSITSSFFTIYVINDFDHYIFLIFFFNFNRNIIIITGKMSFFNTYDFSNIVVVYNVFLIVQSIIIKCYNFNMNNFYVVIV